MANKGKGKDNEVAEAISPGRHVSNKEAGTFKAGFARVVGECEFSPFTITDSLAGNCL
jgi:hypothetical protein